MSRVAIVTHVDLSAPGVVVHAIRATELARALERRGHAVSLIHAPDRGDGAIGRRRAAVDAALAHDVVILSSTLSALSAEIKRRRPECAVVLDLFDTPLAGILPEFDTGIAGELEFERYRLGQEFGAQAPDCFLCATTEQRLWVLGLLSAWGRLSPRTFRDDMVLVVPTGVPREPATSGEPPLFRGRIVPDNARIILWPGGVYSHYRPVALLDALPEVLAACPDARVVFVGASNPAFASDNAAARQLHDRAAAINASAPRVFFEPALPYEHRQRMYLDADVAVCLFDADLETELSFRTRLVDMLWGGMPVVTSRGSSLSELIESSGSGVGIPALDRHAIATALIGILTDPARRAAMHASALALANGRFRWDEVVAPLDAYCRAPRLARDGDGVARRLGLERWGRIDRAVRIFLLRAQRKLHARRRR